MRIMPKKYKQIDFNSDEAGNLAVEIMLNKKCLYDIYKETYAWMMRLNKKYLNGSKQGKMLEIGSGGGFMKALYPDIITSDVRKISGVDMIVDAMNIPFNDDQLDVIFAVHVLHHIPDVTKFFEEAIRTIKPGGGIICVEPYWSPVAKFVYKTMHPEPFNEKAKEWKLDITGPLLGSNQALSYILLKRDADQFKRMFPEFKIVFEKPFGFIRYMATGGIWLEPKLPKFMFPILKGLENILMPIMPLVAIHHIFVIKKM